MDTKFKPCPFCGSEEENPYDHTPECYLRQLWSLIEGVSEPSREEFMKAWNTRHMPPCETCPQVDNRDSFIFHLLRAERTCRMEHNERKRGVYCSHCGKRMDSFVCNNYGDGTMEYAYPFCCKCGAKVVE